jgi:hypothetical protein
MYLVGIILIQKDYCGSISSAYVTYFGRQSDVSSGSKFTIIMLVIQKCTLTQPFYYHVNRFCIYKIAIEFIRFKYNARNYNNFEADF